jgi:multiple sugar transport system ATP-binding protein
VVQQVGTPHEIYRDPANLFVARFIGSPPMTLLAGRAVTGEQGRRFVPERAEADASIPLPADLGPVEGRADLLLGLRPEDIALASPGEATARVDLVEPTGPEDIVTLDLFGQRSVIRTPAGQAKQGSPVSLALRLEHAMLFDRATGARVR